MKLLWLLPLLSIIAISCKNREGSNPPLLAKEGVLDLSTYDYHHNKSVRLNGEWKFVWNEFTDSLQKHKNVTFITVPSPWQSDKGSFIVNQQNGYGTYELTLLLPEANRVWALRLPPIHSAYSLFIDTALITKAGTPDVSAKMQPSARTQIATFIPSRKEVTLRLFVSNFHFVYGGIIAPITLGNPATISTEREKSYFISAFLMGSLFIMSLYHFALFILWRKDKSFLFFGIMCVFMALRESFGGEAMFYHALPNINYALSLKILYLTFPINMYAFVQFFSKLYPVFPKTLRRLNTLACLGYGILVLLTANPFYGKYLIFLSAFFLVISIVLTTIVFRKTIRNPQGNGLVLAGLLILFLSFLNDILYEAGFINSYFLIPFGFFTFTLFQSIILSVRFTKTIKKSHILNVELIKKNQAYQDIQTNFQKEILKTKLEIQEQTLKDISQEIHDNIGQALVFTRLNIESISLNSPEIAQEKLCSTRNALSEIIQDVRQISKTLNTDAISKTGFIEALKQQLDFLQKTGTVTTNLQVEGDTIYHTAQEDLILFRILQELLNNAVKHANASSIEVSVNYKTDRMEIQVKDNGKGFDTFLIQQDSSSGIGLTNISNRIQLLQGSSSIESKPGKGTTVTIILPNK